MPPIPLVTTMWQPSQRPHSRHPPPNAQLGGDMCATFAPQPEDNGVREGRWCTRGFMLKMKNNIQLLEGWSVGSANVPVALVSVPECFVYLIIL